VPQYLIAVPHDAATGPTMASMDPEAIQPIIQSVSAFNDRLRAAGAWVFAGGLQPPSATTRVDNTGDEPIVVATSGVDGREYLGGMWVIDVPDLDAALQWAKDASKACRGPVEIRPFQHEPDS
jgi:hypothetical protein